MPWYVPWSENIKKRICRYLLQRYLGQFLEEKLTLDQLSVDLYNGTGNVSDVSLDCEALNELGESQGWPVEFVDGFIEQISVSIPWATILKDDSFVEVRGLSVTLQPRLRPENGASMLESMWSSMTSSMQLAQECLQQEAGPAHSQPVEGIELFAQTIDSILCRVKIKFTNTKIRLEHVPKHSSTGVAVEIHIQNIDYLDEAGLDDPSELMDSEKNKTYIVSTFSSKKLSFEGVTFHTDEFPLRARTISRSIIQQVQSKGYKIDSNDVDFEYSLTHSNDVFYDTRNMFSSSDNSSQKTKESSPACESTDDSDCAKSSFNKSNVNVSAQSDPILFAKMTGRQELSVKLKQAEQASGPKVDIQLLAGSMICFFSPRQLHVLLELASGLASPHMEDTSNVPNRKGHFTECKPMKQSDFDRVEAQLLGGITQTGTPSLMARHGWSSPNFDDSDPEEDRFFPLNPRHAGQMSYSCLSSISSISGSISSNSSSIGSFSPGNQKIKKNRKVPQVEGDPNAEVSHVNVRLASFACVLLHEDILTLSMALGGDCLASSSIKKMQTTSKSFFDNLGSFAVMGYGNKDFNEACLRFDTSTNFNNLRLIAAPLSIEGNDKTASQGCILSATLTVSKLSFKECLYNMNTANNGTPHVQCIDLISFTRNDGQNQQKLSEVQKNPLGIIPDVKISIKQMKKNVRIGGEKRLAYPTTEINVCLQPCTVNLDITLMDRICAVLNPQVFVHSSESKRSNAYSQPGLIPPATPYLDTVYTVECSCPSFSLKLRFPIADLRPLYDMSRTHWWHWNLRKDYILGTFTGAVFNTSINSSGESTTMALMSRSIDLYYFESETDHPIHIAQAEIDESCAPIDGDIACPTIKVTLAGLSSDFSLLDTMSDDEQFGCMQQMPMAQSAILMDKLTDDKPSPFSSKKMVHESDTPHDKTEQEDAEELIIPGNNKEMTEFSEHSIKNSHLQIECILPTLSIQFNSKHLYEIIYNRINSDLLLWESCAPTGYQKPKVGINMDAVGLNNMDLTESIHPAFSMCKSGINYDSDSDSTSSEDGNVYYSVQDQRAKQRSKLTQPVNKRKKCHVSCFALHVGRGVCTLYTPVRDCLNHVLPSQNGEIVIKAKDLNMCHVSGVNGAPRSALMSLRASAAQLYHCGLVPIPLEKPPLRLYSYSLPSHLEETIYPSEPGICIKNVDQTIRDMLSVAISVQPNKDLPRFKTIRVTAGISVATLSHRTPVPCRSWLSQLMDMMDVLDYPIPGYEPSTVITELHVHLWNSAIDYRPLYVPLRTVITLTSLSISSNVVAQTNASNLRFIAEDCALFLAETSRPTNTNNKRKVEKSVDLLKNYVGVVDLGLFELSLRINDRPGAPLTSIPRVDLRASSSSVHVRTCADSAAALCRLIAYIAADGDRASAMGSAPSSTVGGSVGTLEGDSLVDVEEQQQEEICDLSRSQVEHVNNLITEAMKESLNIEVTDDGKPTSDKEGVEIFFFPDESTPQFSGINVEQNEDDKQENVVSDADDVEEQPLPSIIQVTHDLGDVYSNTKKDIELIETLPQARIIDEAPNTDDEFCMLGLEVNQGDRDPLSPPIVRWLTTTATEVIEDHFAVPLGSADLLKPPKNFPSPVMRYRLCEMTVVWHMYGGTDFKTSNSSNEESSPRSVKKTVSINDVNLYHSPKMQRNEESDPYNAIPHPPITFTPTGVSFSRTTETSRQVHQSSVSSAAVTLGGAGRQHDVLMELQLSKVKFQHETYPATGTYASRQILIVGLVEVRDRLASSHINKFLYHHTSEQQPKQKNANMVLIKAVHMRPDPKLVAQECCLKVSLLPLRLNIDQDALLFLIDFFTKLGEEDVSGEEEGGPNLSGSNQSLQSAGASKHSTPTHQPPVMSMGTSAQDILRQRQQITVDNVMTSSDTYSENMSRDGDLEVEPIMENYEAERLVSDNLIQLEEGCKDMTMTEATSDNQSRTDVVEDLPIYFRSVVFSPDVPIRLDYQGKRVDLTHGPLAGLLMGLGQLNCSELKLKKLSHRHGLLGVERLMKWFLQEWLSDIKRNQLPGLLGGVGPMHSLLQLFQGVRDLIWLPVEQYRRDGRLAKGFRRGAASFTARTAVAALDITARIVYLIQATAETAYDMVSPRPGLHTLRGGRGRGGRRHPRRRDRSNQPQDIRQGVTNAYHLVKEGLNETAHTLVLIAASERDARGYSGAVGGVLRQLPPTVVAPLVLAAAATSDVLGGVRSQLVPDARREASDKWRDDTLNEE